MTKDQVKFVGSLVGLMSVLILFITVIPLILIFVSHVEVTVFGFFCNRFLNYQPSFTYDQMVTACFALQYFLITPINLAINKNGDKIAKK